MRSVQQSNLIPSIFARNCDTGINSGAGCVFFTAHATVVKKLPAFLLAWTNMGNRTVWFVHIWFFVAINHHEKKPTQMHFSAFDTVFQFFTGCRDCYNGCWLGGRHAMREKLKNFNNMEESRYWISWILKFLWPGVGISENSHTSHFNRMFSFFLRKLVSKFLDW